MDVNQFNRKQDHPMELTKSSVKVELISIGEGYYGDYNPDDPDDVELLRFYVFEQDDEGGDWDDVSNASYCTCFAASADESTQRKALDFIMEKVYNNVVSGRSVKRICEKLSYLSEVDFAVSADKEASDEAV